ATISSPSARGGRLSAAAMTGHNAMATADATATRATDRRPLEAATKARPPSAAMATSGPGPSRPSGAVAAVRATSAIHPTITRVGRWISMAARPPRGPATDPPPRPHIITGPAAGMASRLAGRVASGSGPNADSRTGATPAWAARVTANAPASARGPGRRSVRGWANTARPADAPT